VNQLDVIAGALTVLVLVLGSLYAMSEWKANEFTRCERKKRG
jgi:hypothetical protein